MDKGGTPDVGATPDKGATPEGASLFRQRAHTMADTYKKKSSAKKRLMEVFKSKKCGKLSRGVGHRFGGNFSVRGGSQKLGLPP